MAANGDLTPQLSAQFPASSPEPCASWMKQHGVHANPICTPCLSCVLVPRLCFSLPWAVVPSPPGTGCPCYWQISLSLVPSKSTFRLCLGMLLQSHLLQRIPPGCFAGTSCPPISFMQVSCSTSCTLGITQQDRWIPSVQEDSIGWCWKGDMSCYGQSRNVWSFMYQHE